VTHEYTILLGGRVESADGERLGSAIAWAADTILAVGEDDRVAAISRGDSRFVTIPGLVVSPLGRSGSLEVGGPADMVIRDPAVPRKRLAVATVRDGQLVGGTLPGLEP
jgi:predicted amidohydrolase YtcJ